MANEMRLIDARKYEESILLTMRCWKVSPCLSPSEAEKAVGNLRVALTILSNEPTVDAVEVVRCKDCMYCKANACIRKVKRGGAQSIDRVHANFFCAAGKRRTDND